MPDADAFVLMGQQVLDAQPFSVLLGARMVAFVPGEVTLEIALKPDLLDEAGRVHSGVVSYLAANALRFAGGSALGIPVAIAEYKINYLRPAEGMRLVARASVVGTAIRRAVCRSDVWADRDGQEMLVATAQGTVVGTDAEAQTPEPSAE